jgi:hypothetical protein
MWETNNILCLLRETSSEWNMLLNYFFWPAFLHSFVSGGSLCRSTRFPTCNRHICDRIGSHRPCTEHTISSWFRIFHTSTFLRGYPRCKRRKSIFWHQLLLLLLLLLPWRQLPGRQLPCRQQNLLPCCQPRELHGTPLLENPNHPHPYQPGPSCPEVSLFRPRHEEAFEGTRCARGPCRPPRRRRRWRPFRAYR